MLLMSLEGVVRIGDVGACMRSFVGAINRIAGDMEICLGLQGAKSVGIGWSLLEVKMWQ